MVSFFATAAAVAVALFSVSDAQSVNAYVRPGPLITSGVPGNTKALFRRSPCPAINTLANHGYLPRTGVNVTNTQLRDAVMTQFNLELALADRLVSVLPATFDLNFLGTHGIVEHDASLAHADSYLGGDPSRTDPKLLKDMLSRASATKPFDVAIMGKLRKERLAATVAGNPTGYTFGAQQVQLAFGEAALTLTRFGDLATETASYARVQSFFENEKFPADWKTPATVLTAAQLQATSIKIITAASA